MIALSTLDLIKENERKLEDKHIIIFIFVKPSDEISQEIIGNFNYLHHLSDKHCNIYPIGYSATPWSKSQYNDVTKVKGVGNVNWYYSDKAFLEMVYQIQMRTKWKYSGEPEMMILQNNVDAHDFLSFKNYICIRILEGLRKQYFQSFALLIQSILNSAKKYVTSKEVIQDVSKKNIKDHIKLKEIIVDTFLTFRRVPKFVKVLLKDAQFYFTANSRK
ncbi:MAG TPA: hypothetical protein PKG96_02650 [Bacilli bacterium]|jgi:hypothetical protein|nr:hypothetical protein [Bacilli bacterium]HOH95905.1 hypothetical protein [Candidatus Enterocola sp.]HPY55073.1 hypothetical protein [Bacilli bacterium]